jgi:hypothetical protein
LQDFLQSFVAAFEGVSDGNRTGDPFESFNLSMAKHLGENLQVPNLSMFTSTEKVYGQILTSLLKFLQHLIRTATNKQKFIWLCRLVTPKNITNNTSKFRLHPLLLLPVNYGRN